MIFIVFSMMDNVNVDQVLEEEPVINVKPISGEIRMKNANVINLRYFIFYLPTKFMSLTFYSLRL